MPELEMVVRRDHNDTSVQFRIQKIGNGFIVRTGKSQIFYGSIKEVADAVHVCLLNVDWEDGYSH